MRESLLSGVTRTKHWDIIWMEKKKKNTDWWCRVVREARALSESVRKLGVRE